MPERLLIDHCSPTLAGLKTGNMFPVNVKPGQDICGELRQLNRMFREKGVRVVMLRRDDAPEGWQKGFGVSVQTGLSGQGSSVSGSPAMGDEVLEESEFDPMFTDVEQALAGKKIALFGSYGWGDGQWMRDWEDRCREAGAVLAADSVIANDAPGDGESCYDKLIIKKPVSHTP